MCSQASRTCPSPLGREFGQNIVLVYMYSLCLLLWYRKKLAGSPNNRVEEGGKERTVSERKTEDRIDTKAYLNALEQL